jgi:hypothetical protein
MRLAGRQPAPAAVGNRRIVGYQHGPARSQHDHKTERHPTGSCNRNGASAQALHRADERYIVADTSN